MPIILTTINLIICIILVVCNLYLTHISNEDDKLVINEKDFEFQNYLLKINKYNRMTYMCNTLFICGLLIMLLFLKFNIWTSTIEIFCMIYCVRKLIQTIRTFYIPTEAQDELILHWMFKFVDEIDDKKFSQEMCEKMLQQKIARKSVETNIRVCKFNKSFERMEKRVKKFVRNHGKELK